MDKPILFNTEMVKAILEGRKTSTRRIIKNKYENANIEYFTNKYGTRLVYAQNDVPEPVKNSDGTTSHKLRAMEEIKKPFNTGDILYVRETWANTWTPDGEEGFVYKADGEPAKFPYWGNANQCKDEVWIPSIHMPRAAARIFLGITDVRAERLQDITEDASKKEGCSKITRDSYTGKFFNSDNDNYRDGFIETWDSCYKWPKCWTYNPWVWVIEFEKLDNYKI